MCAVGLFFPLGWLVWTAVGLLTGGVGNWGHIVPVEAPGISVPIGAYLDNDPFLSRRVGADIVILPAVVDSHSVVLGAFLVRSTPTTLDANVEIIYLAKQGFRNGRSRFTGNTVTEENFDNVIKFDTACSRNMSETSGVLCE
jgi:hypothetical protein